MAAGVWITAVYDVSSETNAVERVTRICRDVGFEVNESEARERSENYYTLPVSYDDWDDNISFNLDASRSVDEPLFSFSKLVYDGSEEETDHEAIEAIFQLICQFATKLDAAYVPLFNSEQRSMEVVPEDRPIPAAVETPPKLGVYADDVLAGFGGVEGLFDHEPWYVADLEGEHTLVIENESPWGDWRPPTDAPYIRSARFSESDAASRTDQSEELVLSDPFAALEPGEYGTDVCVRQDDIAAEFRNEDLELVRVSVGEDGTLRRVSDGSFVRNVLADGPDDNQAFVKAMLSEVPEDAAPTEPMVSVLLNETVPPAFVRADDPEDETVVSRALELHVTTNRVELLASLGRAVQYGDELDASTVESALEELSDAEDADRVEAFIETRLV